MKLAVIPARGGSKRIARKNIRNFAGRPMITWSIRTALGSGLFDEVLVSTDDEEIAEISRAAGATVPFVRPKELSGDFTGTIPVIAHAVDWGLGRGWPIDIACCIYATAPGLREEDLSQGLAKLQSSDADFVFSATDFAAPILRSFVETDEGRIRMLWPENFEARSQDLPRALHDAAQFYWGRTSAWLEGKPIFSERSQIIVLPRYRVQDIDTEDDWIRAEALFAAMCR